MVKLPNNPIVMNFCSGSLEIESKLNDSRAIPNRKEPKILIKRIENGKAVPNIMVI